MQVSYQMEPDAVVVTDELGLRLYVGTDDLFALQLTEQDPETALLDLLTDGVRVARAHPHLYRKARP